MIIMEVEVGSVYKVDHNKLPQSANIPASLNCINAVLVNEKSNEEVTVVFPSNKSLKRFFDDEKFTGSMQPNLDEKFTMGVNLSSKILTQKVTFEEFAAKRGSKNFWVYDDNIDDHDHDHDHDGGLMIRWGTRPRTRVYSRRSRVMSSVLLPCVVKKFDDDLEEEKVVVGDDDDHKEEVLEKPRVLRKRKCHFMGVKYSEKNRNKSKGASGKKFIDPQHRWTVDRYRLAEENMLKIMKEKGAGPRNPILRSELRGEARKLIGDTGLLDHLLKHMAGRLTPGGKERFRRRHNPEGAMEYWMESADLVDIRKKEGIDDLYWVPPPGWKSGDCPTQDPVCAMQLNELRVEVANIKREVQMLACSKGQDANQTLVNTPARLEGVQRLNFEGSPKPLKMMYERVLEKKANVEKQLLDIYKSFSRMEEEVVKLKGLTSPADEEEMLLQPGKPTLQEDVVATTAATIIEDIEERRQRLKSGFRICKPQGSFLWPSQVASSPSSQSQVVINFQNFLGYPTPPSVTSSSISTPSLTFLSQGNQQQQQPLSTVTKPVATKPALTLTFSTAITRGSTTIESIASPTSTAGYSVNTDFIPNLNEVPLLASIM